MTRLAFAVTGNPVEHSKSPALFRAAYHGKYAYDLLPAASVEEAMRLFFENGLYGMNVTMPFKTGIIRFADISSDDVLATEAANTMVREGNKMAAYNTDVAGVRDAILANGNSIRNQSCLVLGAGGAGRAAAYALQKEGGIVTLANRTFEKAASYAEKINIHAASLNNAIAAIGDYRIIINTLPAMLAEFLKIVLNPQHILLDASYAQRPLYEKAQQANALYIDGLEWLLYQAIHAFRLFTGEAPDVDAMKKVL